MYKPTGDAPALGEDSAVGYVGAGLEPVPVELAVARKFVGEVALLV